MSSEVVEPLSPASGAAHESAPFQEMVRKVVIAESAAAPASARCSASRSRPRPSGGVDRASRQSTTALLSPLCWRTLPPARIRQRPAALSLLRLWAHLQRPERHAAGATQAQAEMARVFAGAARFTVRTQRCRPGWRAPQYCLPVGPHRFLAWVKLDRPRSLNGIVEADETFLLESQKGSRTLDRPARRRGGRAPMRDISRHGLHPGGARPQRTDH